MKPVRPRALAQADVAAALAAYAREGGPALAGRFIAALEAAYAAMAEYPGAGSPRYAEQLDLPGLRHRRLGRFPWVVLYWEQPDYVDVLRVLDARCDVPAWLGGHDGADG